MITRAYGLTLSASLTRPFLSGNDSILSDPHFVRNAELNWWDIVL